jgi:transitional endoplasmic reticulum ATPase
VPSRKEDSHHSTLSEVNEFLVQLNNCASRGVYVLAMTNNINMIDGAVLRKGRIDEVIYVPEPDYEARREMFRLELDKCTLKENDIDFDKLADMTRGYTSSDITFIVKESSREAFRLAIETENLVNVDQSLLEKIIQQTSPSISEKDIKHYESMRDEFINKKKQIDIRPRIGFAV